MTTQESSRHGMLLHMQAGWAVGQSAPSTPAHWAAGNTTHNTDTTESSMSPVAYSATNDSQLCQASSKPLQLKLADAFKEQTTLPDRAAISIPSLVHNGIMEGGEAVSNTPAFQCPRNVPWAIDPLGVLGTAAPVHGVGKSKLQATTVLLVLTGKRARWRVLRSLVQSGVQLLMYNPDQNWASDFIPPKNWIIGPLHNWDEALRRVQAFPGAQQLDAVYSYDEFGLELAAHLAEKLGLKPCMPSAVIARLRNKYNFRRTCKEAGLPAPGFMLLPGAFDAAAKEQFEKLQIGFPVVVKPVKGAGSCLVRKARTMEELRRFVDEYRAGLPSLMESWGLSGPDDPGCALLLESFLVGVEVDIDVVVHSGQIRWISISDNFPPPAGTLMESGGRCPSTLPHEAQYGLNHLMHGLAGLFGDQLSGVFHVEAMWTAQGAVPIEFNARVGGAEAYTMVQEVWGLDLAREALRIALGQRLPVLAAPRPLKFCHSVNFVPTCWKGEGILQRTVLGSALNTDSALSGVELHHDAGALLALPPVGYAYMGWMAATGKDPQEAEQALVRLEQLVQFEFCAPPAVPEAAP